MKVANYSLLIVSQIPVQNINNEFHSLDLWCKDINANSKVVNGLGIFCPITESTEKGVGIIDPCIEIYSLDSSISLDIFESVIKKYDVIQLGAGRPFWHCRSEFLALFYAKKNSKFTIYSISSNRVKLTLLNAAGKSFLKQSKQKIIALSIYLTQRFFSRYSDGVILVGSGLKAGLGVSNKNIHIGLASWINKEDILAEGLIKKRLMALSNGFMPRLCICTRLEKMKGVHLAIEALSILKNEWDFCPGLSIYGAGSEKGDLEKLVKENALQNQVVFMGTVAYGEIFFTEIRQYDLMLLTNLSDEQPRLIFDAISQGLLPVCPNTAVYKAAGLDDKLLYKQNSAVDLAAIVRSFTSKALFSEMVELSGLLLKISTIEKMHLNRVNWVKELL